MLRIIAGKYRSRKLKEIKSKDIRPTQAKVKKSILEILEPFSDKEVLDLFSGSGALGIEALSRGAKKVISIEKNIKCINFIKKFSKELGFSIETLKSDVYYSLKKIDLKFDIIFADPPYDFEIVKYKDLISIISYNKILKKEGIIVIEHSSLNDLSTISNFVQYRKYGDTGFSFFKF